VTVEASEKAVLALSADVGSKKKHQLFGRLAILRSFPLLTASEGKPQQLVQAVR
jgi:hypothetical protein